MSRKRKIVFAHDSIRIEIIAIIIGLIFPVNIFLIYSTSQSTRIVFEQVKATTESSLNLIMNQLDKEMSSIDSYFFQLYDGSASFNRISEGVYNDNYKLAQITLLQDFAKQIVTNYNTDGLFIFNENIDDLMLMTSDKGKKQEKTIREFIKSEERNLISEKWSIIDIDGSRYLIRIFNWNDFYYGGFILLNDIEGEVGEQFEYAIVDVLFEREPSVVLNEAQVLFYSQSASADVYLNMIIEKEEIYQNLPFLQRYNYQLAVSMLLLVPILLLLLNHILIKPLHRINTALRRIESGEIDYRIGEYKTSLEFRQINKSFNNMMDQIKDLEIEKFERELEKQELELTNLQIQMQPHFLLNMLNLIFSLAQLNDFKSIQQMVTYLTKFLRHSFRNANELTTLEKEMDFVQSYLQIANMRYPDCFDVIYEIDTDIFKQEIPPLIIQNAVENTIKYTLRIGEKRNIMIRAKKVEDGICIQVMDDGEGIAHDILEMIHKEEPVMRYGEKHIGIWNCKKRLRMFYGEEASYVIDSEEGKGTKIEVLIPCSQGRKADAAINRG